MLIYIESSLVFIEEFLGSGFETSSLVCSTIIGEVLVFITLLDRRLISLHSTVAILYARSLSVSNYWDPLLFRFGLD